MRGKIKEYPLQTLSQYITIRDIVTEVSEMRRL